MNAVYADAAGYYSDADSATLHNEIFNFSDTLECSTSLAYGEARSNCREPVNLNHCRKLKQVFKFICFSLDA